MEPTSDNLFILHFLLEIWHKNVRNRKYKLWCLAIAQQLTKRTITSNLDTKKTVPYVAENRNLVLAWDRHIDMARLNQLTWPQLSPLDDWIYSCNTDINKRLQNLHTKRPHNVTKMNGNTNMDSTIEGSRNARS